MKTFNLPELGEGLSEGEVVSWQVREGETIHADQTLVEIMTDKATVAVPSPATGVVKKVYYRVGENAKVGRPLVDIQLEGAEEKTSVPKHSESKTKTSSSAEPVQREVRDSQKVFASPAVRKMARDRGIDLAELKGSGERGRILRSDVPVVAHSAVPLPTALAMSKEEGMLEERTPFIGIRRKIAERLSLSQNKAVHFAHFDEIDFTEVIRLREEMNQWAERQGLNIRLTYLPFFIKGTIAALRKFPILNSSLDEISNEIVIKHYYHFGISIQTDHGLVVGVVRDCDKKNVFQLAHEIKEVADRARSGSATHEDLTGSTITVTNPGNIGGLYATPVINFPETVILGMFQIKKRPVVREVQGQEVIVARPMMYTNVTCDHRIVDGAVAAAYLRQFCEFMESPAKMAFI